MARLANPALKSLSREIPAYAILATILAAIVAYFILTTPTVTPPIRAKATIVRFGTYDPNKPLLEPEMAVVVDIVGVGRRTLIERASLINRCQVGDSVLVLGDKINAGGTDWGFPLTGCSPLPPDSPHR